MTLVDTSAWIDHLRRPDPDLALLLEAEQVLTHPFILGELGLGNLRERDKMLGKLGLLEAVPIAPGGVVEDLVRRHHLWGKGVGCVDCHLLAAAREAHAHLMTRDKALRAVWLIVRKG